MNTLRLLFVLGSVGALVAAAGCDPKAKCVADCDTAGLDSDGSDESGGSASEESGSPGDACGMAEQAALAFIEANRQCTTHADCKSVEGICFQGGPTACGTIGLASSADDAQWDALHDALEQSCECGAPACGATTVCTAEGICEAQFGTMEAQCAEAEQEVERFLAENRACEVDADCVLVEKGCYDGPLAECSAVPLNVDADPEVWDGLQAQLGACGNECGGNDCGPEIRCGADGLCEAIF